MHFDHLFESHVPRNGQYMFKFWVIYSLFRSLTAKHPIFHLTPSFSHLHQPPSSLPSWNSNPYLRWWLSNWSIFWQQRSQHCLSFSPSTLPYFHIFPSKCVLVYSLSSWKRCVRPMCVMTTAHVNCVVCDGFSVRNCDSKVHVCTLCGSVFRDAACVLTLRLICWGSTKPDKPQSVDDTQQNPFSAQSVYRTLSAMCTCKHAKMKQKAF